MLFTEFDDQVNEVHLHAFDSMGMENEKREMLTRDMPAFHGTSALNEMSELTKADKVRWIVAELERLYPETPVPLDHTDPYTLLVAVLLSAQCTDERVNKVTPRFLNWPTTLGHDEAGGGRHQSHHSALRVVPEKERGDFRIEPNLVEEHGGEVPANFQALEPSRGWVTKPPGW